MRQLMFLLRIKLTNEIALITAVSDLKIFFDSEKEIVLLFETINSLSFGEKSPSGPIKITIGFSVFKSLDLILFLALTSANKS